MNTPKVLPAAVRLHFEHEGEHESQWAAIGSIAAKIGSTVEMLPKYLGTRDMIEVGVQGRPSPNAIGSRSWNARTGS